MKIFTYILLALLYTATSFAQTKSEKAKITKDYNLEKLALLANEYATLESSQKNEAVRLAKLNDWALTYTDDDGSYHELMRVTEEGNPIYYSTFNRNASRSTRTKWLNTAGGMGLNINGEDMTAYIWDNEHAYMTHQEFENESGETRVILGDATTPEYVSPADCHGTHVSGTVIANGTTSSAKGMAPKASLMSYTWSGDMSEVTAAASDGMLVSNHSYGLYLSNVVDDWKIGAYTMEARLWDNIAYNAPHFLKVIAAGNDGNDNYSNSVPIEGNSLYDKLIGDTVSKNPLVVAAGNDLSVNAVGEIVSTINIATFSSEGPTDDYRVKPDITGNGTGVYSPVNSSNTSYSSFDGTSMASPNVMGSLLLLQQLYNEENGEFLLSSTLKGLALHTATDAGSIGPDTKFGWGYMDTKKAAECILGNGSTSQVSVFELTNGGSYIFTVTADGLNDLQASICWTDKPSNNVATNESHLNRTDSVLVNDLDIRISQDDITFMPWKLTSVTSNEKADNNKDVFERIDIADASGDYTITVSHKGDLVDNQTFSLIVTGITEFVGTEDQNFANFKIWPNPNKGIFNIEIEDTDTNNLSINISNLLGKVVFSKTYSNQVSFSKQFDFNHLPSGIYTVSVDSGNKKSTNKIIIE